MLIHLIASLAASWALASGGPRETPVELPSVETLTKTVVPQATVSGAPLALGSDAIHASEGAPPLLQTETRLVEAAKASTEEQPRAKHGPEVRAFLEAARAGSQSDQARTFVAEAHRLFDGLAPGQRQLALETMETVARARPKDRGYRYLLQDLIVRDELARVEPRLLGKELTAERRDEVLAKTKFRDLKWYHHLWGEELPVPTGIARRHDRSIGINVRSGWRGLASFVGFYRTIFSHEYTHRLQFEGEVTVAYGMEPPAVATELLRAVELFGLDALKAGASPVIAEGLLDAFEEGRRWLREGRTQERGFFWKGFMAGAAYELALETGRWSDAWAFHRLVSSGTAPAEAAARVRASLP